MSALATVFVIVLVLFGIGCGGGGAGSRITGQVGVNLSPTTTSLAPGGNQQFYAVVGGTSNSAVTWTVAESGGGSITSAGLYTAPASTGTFHVIATSQADSTISGTATVVVTTASNVTISVSPLSAMTIPAGTQQFTATIGGATDNTASWAVQENNGGSVSSTGLYTAPSSLGTFHVVATSNADPSKSASAAVTVAANGTVFVSPSSASLGFATTQQFSATVLGTSTNAVTWSLQENGGGTVTSAGLYSAPSVAGTYHLIATSQADSTKIAVVTITVVPPVVVTISPTTLVLGSGNTHQFTATVTGNANTAVTWSVSEQAGGSISSSGLYTSSGAGGPFHVVARSTADISKTAAATVTVSNDPGTGTITVRSKRSGK